MPAPPPYGVSSTWPAERRRVAVVEKAELEFAAEHARDRLLLGHPGIGMRREVKTSMRIYSGRRSLRRRRFALQILPHAGLDERQERAESS
jgi:hypothetical protein